MRVSRGLAGLLLLSLAACNDDEQGKLKLSDYDGGAWPEASTKPKPKDAGFDAETDGGDAADGDAGDDAGPAAAPNVSVMNIVPVTDPVLGPVLTGPSLDVQCSATQSATGTPVDTSSVVISVLDETGKELSQDSASLRAPDLYGASVSLSGLSTGPVTIRCSASDSQNVTKLIGFGEVLTYYDAGPEIRFENLDANSIVPLGKTSEPDFSVIFKVLARGFVDGDPGAEVGDVTLKIRDTPVALPQLIDGKYTKPVDFSMMDGASTIKSLKISVTATNKRSPVPAVATRDLEVRVDGDSPVINITQPGNGTIVGGKVKMRMTITDELSGVSRDVKKTYASFKVGSSEKESEGYPLTYTDGDNYELDFEATRFPGESNVTVNIYAADEAGNSQTEDLLILFDTVPPWISLSSPLVRVCSRSSKACSKAFKALGNTPQDGSFTLSDARYRALVWERGIYTPGSTQTWISGVQGSVFLYAQNDPNVPLLIDTNNDGFCDAVDEKPANGGKEPVKHQLDPVSKGGALPPTVAGELQSDPSIALSDPEDPNTVSDYGPWTSPADPKCASSEMNYVISQMSVVQDPPTAVYARNPKDNATACTGTSFNLGLQGWTCVAASVSDASGNVGISVPIKVCRSVATGDCPSEPPANLVCNTCTLSPVTVNSPLGSRIFLN